MDGGPDSTVVGDPGVTGAEEEEPVSFPYPVATCQGPGFALRAFYKDASWQWVWFGTHHYCQVKAQAYTWVKENKQTILADMSDAGIDLQGLHMGKEHTDYRWGTTLSSKAMLLVLLSFGKRKRMGQATKARGLALVNHLLDQCWAKLGGHLSSTVGSSLAFWHGNSLKTVSLAVTPTGQTTALQDLATHVKTLAYAFW